MADQSRKSLEFGLVDNSDDLLKKKTELQTALYNAEISLGMNYEEAQECLKWGITPFPKSYSLSGLRKALGSIDEMVEDRGKDSLIVLRKKRDLGMTYAEALERLNLAEEDEFEVGFTLDVEALKSFVQTYSPVINEINKIKGAVFQANQGRVFSLAKKYNNNFVDWMDLIQEGNIGLIEAIETYDADSPYTFASHAFLNIRSGIVDFLRNSRVVRISSKQSATARDIKGFVGRYSAEMGRDPTSKEILDELKISERNMLMALEVSQSETSLNNLSVSGDEFLSLLMHPLQNSYYGLEGMNFLLTEAVEKSLTDGDINERESLMLKHYYGLGVERLSFEEIGDVISKLTFGRKKIKEATLRKIKARAVKKLASNEVLQRLFDEIKD